MLSQLGVQAPALSQFRLGLGVLAGALNHHHELALALVVVGFHPRQQFGQRAVQHCLEQLGRSRATTAGRVGPNAAAMSASDSAMRCEDS